MSNLKSIQESSQRKEVIAQTGKMEDLKVIKNDLNHNDAQNDQEIEELNSQLQQQKLKIQRITEQLAAFKGFVVSSQELLNDEQEIMNLNKDIEEQKKKKMNQDEIKLKIKECEEKKNKVLKRKNEIQNEYWNAQTITKKLKEKIKSSSFQKEQREERNKKEISQLKSTFEELEKVSSQNLEEKKLFFENRIKDLTQKIEQNEEKEKEQQIRKEIKQYDQKNKQNQEQLQFYEKKITKQSQEIEECEQNIKKKKNQNHQLKEQNNQLNQTINQQEQELKQKINDFNLSNINIKSNNEVVEQLLNELNPSTQIEINHIEFTKQLAIIAQNPLTEIEKNKMIEKEKICLSEYNTQTNPQMLNSAIIKQYFKQKGIEVYVTNKVDGTVNSNKQQIQDTLLFTGDCKSGQYFSLQFQDKQFFSSIMINQDSIQNYIKDFKLNIGNHLNLQPQKGENQIVVMKIGTGQSPSIDFQVNHSDEETAKKLKTYQQKGLSVWIKNLIDHAQLSAEMFDSNYDMDWTGFTKGQSEIRGSLPLYQNLPNYTPQPYYFPVGFKGYGLRVGNKYGQNTEWLSTSSSIKTWVALFHGTSDKNIKSILNSYIKQGHRDAYSGAICRITNKPISSKSGNVYLSDSVDVAAHFSVPSSTFNGNAGYILLEFRVQFLLPLIIQSRIHNSIQDPTEFQQNRYDRQQSGS